MTDTITEIVTVALLVAGTGVCICAGLALVTLLLHVVLQWLWAKMKAAHGLKELSDALRAWEQQKKNTGDTEQ